jgi:hypothetical protein
VLPAGKQGSARSHETRTDPSARHLGCCTCRTRNGAVQCVFVWQSLPDPAASGWVRASGLGHVSEWSGNMGFLLRAWLASM